YRGFPSLGSFSPCGTSAAIARFVSTTTHTEKTIMKTVAKSGLKVRSAIKAGGLTINHNRSGLKVRSAVKAGGLTINHNRSGLKVRSAVKAGGLTINHNRSGLKVRSAVKA